jgi:hypothetical protein
MDLLTAVRTASLTEYIPHWRTNRHCIRAHRSSSRIRRHSLGRDRNLSLSFDAPESPTRTPALYGSVIADIASE